MLRIIPVAVLTLLLAACGGGTPDPEADESASPTPTIVATDDAETDPAEAADDTEDADPAPEPEPGLSAADRENVRDAITSGNTAAIEGYLSDPVRVIIMSSECCWDISRADAVDQLSYVTGAPGPWNFALPAATVDPWRTNMYYGYLFTGDDITGRAADGTIVSFGIEGGQITKILMGFEEGFSY
ncbi:hypothetical protein [Pseudolysinimonas yzui]|uniref:Lipoprotein n=1 Tax=Pseudolysinimonas yzui TaxID=2708254 RepID=A0A8J3DZJ2_9MICO|nr:hypothetical protein [Pseudolysinimonas yzui]GHF03863.1 hypothetical protein GCM10011600_00180 [Pseudolysinimonas yzui]